MKKISTKISVSDGGLKGININFAQNLHILIVGMDLIFCLQTVQNIPHLLGGASPLINLAQVTPTMSFTMTGARYNSTTRYNS